VVHAWRIVKTKYLSTAFTGEGASLEGGRWNSPGVRVVYTSSSPSLALLETLVNLESTVPLPAYSLVHVEFEEALVEYLPQNALPPNWLRYPPPIDTQQLGDLWIAECRSCVLAVPSTVVTQDTNYMLNPIHPAFGTISIGKPTRFPIDPRLRTRIGSA
jgi:RES domain-containing protein